MGRLSLNQIALIRTTQSDQNQESPSKAFYSESSSFLCASKDSSKHKKSQKDKIDASNNGKRRIFLIGDVQAASTTFCQNC
jgi:hypothetical protein